MLRIGLIEPNLLLRAGRALVVNSQQDMQVVFEESNATLALNRIGEYLVDVLVVNLQQQGFEVFEYIPKLRSSLKSQGNDSAVIAFANFANEDLRLAALRAGADDLVGMDTEGAVFLKKIRDVALHDYRVELPHSVNPGQINSPINAKLRELESYLDQADENQRGILNLFQNGLGDAQIAKQLDVSRTKISKYLDSLVQLANLFTRTQLSLAIRELNK